MNIDMNKRLLFVTPVSPFRVASGAEQRSALIFQGLSQIAPVDVLQLTQGNSTKVWRSEETGNICVKAEVHGANMAINRYNPKQELTRAITSALGRQLQEYSLIVGRYTWPVCQLAVPKQVPIVVDLDDWRYRYSSEAPITVATIRERLSKSIAHQLARRQIHRFSGVFLASWQDRKEIPGSTLATSLPNIPFSGVNACPPPAHTKTILFVGSLWYRPNAEGIEWFLRHVWPQILTAEPTTTFTLVGAAPQETRARWEKHRGVSAPGYVDDLAAVYATSTLVIAPIMSGGGSNIKVLEAMAHGKPCLATPLTAQAFADRLQEDKHLLVAHNKAQFAEKAIAVLRRPELYQPLVSAALGLIHINYSKSSFSKIVTDFCEGFIESNMN